MAVDGVAVGDRRQSTQLINNDNGIAKAPGGLSADL